MKPRNKPTALIVALGTLVLVAFGYNLSKSGLLPDAKQPVKDAPLAESAGPKTDAATVASQVKAEVKAKPKGDPKKFINPDDEDGYVGRGEKPGDDPTIIMPEPGAAIKPTPNESATSTQWYDKESLNGSR